MKFIPQSIPDILLIEPRVFEDPRGFFYESFSQPLFASQGIREAFVQDNHVRSTQGVLRGLHYQIEPFAQSKLVRVIKGRIFDVAVDIRKASPTYGKYVGITLDAKDHKLLYVPVGFAHGYLSLEDGTEVLYKVSQVYSPSHERGIIWNDPSIGIKWPQLKRNYIFSEKDQKYPLLEKATVF